MSVRLTTWIALCDITLAASYLALAVILTSTGTHQLLTAIFFILTGTKVQSALMTLAQR